MSTPLLDVQSVHKSFASQSILAELSLQLDAGQRMSIQGPSGCGKSTLLRILAGLENADHGRIFLHDQEANRDKKILLQPWQRGIQMVFQDLGLWPTRSVLQHLVDVRKASGLPLPKAVGEKILAQLGLIEFKNRRPGKLSGGEARRLAFARVMALEPKLILLDEAFSSLDPDNREQGFEVLEQVLSATGAAVILVTHDPAEAKRLGGKAYRMMEGKLQCV
ncbi:MAG: ATP-binding cassette domain-containing protein [Planctomycetota bacterium]